MQNVVVVGNPKSMWPEHRYFHIYATRNLHSLHSSFCSYVHNPISTPKLPHNLMILEIQRFFGQFQDTATIGLFLLPKNFSVIQSSDWLPRNLKIPGMRLIIMYAGHYWQFCSADKSISTKKCDMRDMIRRTKMWRLKIVCSTQNSRLFNNNLHVVDTSFFSSPTYNLWLQRWYKW